ncbi:MAG TPA: LysR family transcriptional regulator [Chthonomonadaceae bacterium]|nr:LysR family transcriptional regulator [Chthonomonadaceae bacterium]
MNERFNLYPLHVFLLVTRYGSVTRAAQELCISQPAVSAHIKALEARYGEPLFERTPRGMALTPVGDSVARHASRLFAQIEDIEHAVKAAHGQVRGEVRIAASSTPGAYLLPGLLRRFKERYPEAEPTLMLGDSAQVLAWLYDYQVALGVLGEMPKMAAEGELRHERIGEDELRLTTAPDNPLCQVEKIAEEHLGNQSLFLREKGSSTRAGAEKLLGDWLEKFDRVVEVTSAEAIKEAVIAGLGIAVLSSLATRREEAGGLLGPVRDVRFRQKRSLYLVCRADRPPVGAAEALWTFLTSGQGIRMKDEG